MHPIISSFNKSVNATGVRELVLFAIAAALAIVFFLNAIFISPTSSAIDSASRNEARLIKEISEIQSAIDEHESGKTLPEELRQLESRIQAASNSISVLGVGSAEPERLFGEIAQSLKNAKRVKVETLNSRKIRSRMPRNAAHAPQLVRHDYELKISGKYADIVQVVKQVSGKYGQVRWGNLTYTVVDYPQAVATIQLYVFSYQEGSQDV